VTDKEIDNIIKGKTDLESNSPNKANRGASKTTKGSVFYRKRRTEQSTDQTPSLHQISKMDFNNMKFDFSQMIFDDNERAVA